MGPDDFRRRPANPSQPRPPQNPNNLHRPAMDGFAQPPRQPRPPHPVSQPAVQRTPQQNHKAGETTDLKQQAEDFKKQKKQHRTSKLKKWLLIVGVPALLILVLLGLTVFKSDSKKPVAQTEVKLVPPEFSVYYPSSMPEGLNATKKSINYSKDSFSFILQQNGQNHFFINEQPASTDPDFNTLKGQLTTPTSITTTLGPGITGTVDGGTITAAKTEKNTIITINCVKITCEPLSEQILSSMQVNDNVDSLRHSNL